MTYELLLDALDFDNIVEAIHTVKLKQDDAQDCASMVLKALKKWGVQDYLGLAIEGIEQRFAVEFPKVELGQPQVFIPHVDITDEESASYGPRSVKGYVDLVGVRGAGICAGDSHVRAGGGDLVREVIDWKTTSNISSDQQDRVRHSWQGRLYAATYQAQRVVFRSIQRDCRATELHYDWPSRSYCDIDVCEHFGKALDLRETFRHSDKWLQHAPSACGAFGRDCTYREVCLVHNQAPRKLIELRPLSYSGTETFLLCPERYRLNTVLDGDKGSDSTDLGTAFHAGVACAWEQIKKLQEQA